jgi:hypothetical protein
MSLPPATLWLANSINHQGPLKPKPVAESSVFGPCPQPAKAGASCDFKMTKNGSIQPLQETNEN